MWELIVAMRVLARLYGALGMCNGFGRCHAFFFHSHIISLLLCASQRYSRKGAGNALVRGNRYVMFVGEPQNYFGEGHMRISSCVAALTVISDPGP